MPAGWRWHSFDNPKGRRIRFGTAAPAHGIPDAIVIGLQGLGEFTEKYFETANDLISRNLSFWMMDWQGQGQSHRPLKDPHKRHSDGFDADVSDLHYFIMEYVKHSAVHPDVGRIPLVFLGHSMGANIGLHYLKQYPDLVACAAFTAPLVKIRATRFLPDWAALGLTGTLAELMDQTYLEWGGKQWSPAMREGRRSDIHSSDPARKAVHNAWCLHDPALQVGNITYVWLHEAHLACARLRKKGYLESIETPCLFALAGQEALVDNDTARKALSAMPHAVITDLPEAKHEILMERDDIRDAFFKSFAELLAVNNIKEKLKPF